MPCVQLWYGAHGLPQSYVSESIAALREDGTLETTPDPKDRRRTLVTISPTHRRRVAERASTPMDAVLVEEIGKQRATLVLPVLQRLAELLTSDQTRSIVATVRAGDQARPREPD